ncbi:MAG: xanthine dehydrogenase family protein molybdopterin-binding subunit [Chloroflexi bacterium]|nr:xanthine dehydrogenase family protein molybdopterin-binding subunit [Chloroflexota bacterium]
MIDELETIGHAVLKPDAWLKATGAATYTGDVRLPAALEAKVLRSPYPHARIVNIDTSEAEALPGVYAVVTGKDVVKPTGDHWVLARDKVIWAGQAVAAVAAVDEEAAQQAIALIRVEYEDLPAILEPEEAARPDSVPIHPEPAGTERSASTGNVRTRAVFEIGDVDAAFAAPGVIIHEAVYRTPRQAPVSTETHSAVAHVEGSGKVTIWASIKAPFRARTVVANALGFPLSRVRIVAPLIGGDFGGKGGGFVEPIAALLALKSGHRPVRLMLTRTEEFQAVHVRPAFVVRLKMAAEADGTVVALEGEQLSNIGATDEFQGARGGAAGRAAAAAISTAYRIPNMRFATTSVFTNTSPAGAVRAPAGPHNALAMESHMDRLARDLHMDPLQLRLKNILRNGDAAPNGAILRNSGLEECIARAQTWLAQNGGAKDEGQAPSTKLKTGVGIALGTWAYSPRTLSGESSATVKVDVDGSVVVLTGAADQGGGQWTMVAQVASEVLGVPMDRVTVVAADTDATPLEGGIGGSNATYRIGNSVRQAAEDAREKLLRLASERLNVDSEELGIKDSQVFVRSDPGRRISVAEVAHAATTSPAGAIMGSSAPVREREIQQHGREQAETADAPSTSCSVAQIEVDPETGIIRVQRYFTAQDVGRAINLLGCRGQIEGGVVFGLGYALTEELRIEDGTPVNTNLWEYLLTTAPHIPDLTIEIVEVPSTFGPFGAKGIGETPCIPVAAAIANALEDAIGVRVTEAPFTPERVLAAIAEKG